MPISYKKITVVLFCLLISRTLFAQLQQVSSHYMFNQQVNNPAFYGVKDGLSFGANYRHQWSKLDGQPRTITVYADAKVSQIHGGVGFSIYNDIVGAYNNTACRIGYTFIQHINNKIKLSIGLNGGAVISKLDGSKLITPEGIGVSLNDDYLSSQVQKSVRPDLTIGIALLHKYVEIGINYTNLINLPDMFKGDVQVLKVKYGGVLQFYVGSKIRIKEDFYVRPSLFLVTDFKEIQTDIGFMAGYKSYFSIGLNARGYNKKSFESLSPIINFGPFKNVSFTYSYDVALNELNKINRGSHEVTLDYFIPTNKLFKNPKQYNNPRFL